MDDNAIPLAEVHPSVTEESILLLVRTFYDRARQDELIGPVFNREVEDWETHIATIADFWSALILRTRRYNGRPMRPHLMLKLEPQHFDRWLELFRQTAREIYTEPHIADGFIERANRIADSFQMAIASLDGQLYTPRHHGML